jgi:hypothetical protein
LLNCSQALAAAWLRSTVLHGERNVVQQSHVKLRDRHADDWRSRMREVQGNYWTAVAAAQCKA